MQRLLLVLLVAVSYLLFAGGRPWTLGPLLAIAVAAALMAPRRTFAILGPWRALDLALLALAGAMALQLVPLPASIVSMLSPHRVEITTATRMAQFGGAAPAWVTLSVDPNATLVSLASVVLGVLALWSSRATFSAGGSTRSFCRALTIIGTLFAVAALLQKAVSPRSVLFMIEPDARSASPFGAFVNRNHFGGWLLMVASPVAGYFVARTKIHPLRRGRWRESIGQVMRSGIVFTAIALIAIVGVLLATLSRSALTGLGVAALVGWRLGRPRLNTERTSLPAALGVIGAVMLIVMVFVDVDRWATRVAESFDTTPAPLSRTAIWQESLPVARDFWLTGTGAGTFSDAMIVYQESRVWIGAMRRWAHFNNAHSHYLQVACEGGLLLCVPVLWALVALARLGYRAVRSDKGEMFWVRVGAAAGLAGIAVQSIWETSLIMPANAVLAGVLGGLLLYRREVRRDAGPSPPELLTPPVRVRMA
ncbi:MAG TPA: O-antigen ligase family protein [Vicinamibacterales bacterium]|nr:O-antigen ligase family protein [Vicinamibacterales bacterium]